MVIVLAATGLLLRCACGALLTLAAFWLPSPAGTALLASAHRSLSLLYHLFSFCLLLGALGALFLNAWRLLMRV